MGSIDKSPGDQELIDALGIESLDILQTQLSASKEPWHVFRGIYLLAYKYRQYEQQIDGQKKEEIIQLLVTRAELLPKGRALDFLHGIDHLAVRNLGLKYKDSKERDARLSAERLLHSLDGKVPDDAITALKHTILPRILGRVIPPEVEKQVELTGQPLPELQNVPIHGARPIAIDVPGSVKTIVFIKDHVLVSLGYLFPVPVHKNSKALEETLLSEYSFSEKEFREAIGPDFSTVKITIQRYVNQTSANLHAVSYTHGLSRTLILYDASAVDYHTMLPATPEAAGKASVEKMKAEGERMKALIEQAKADQKTRQTQGTTP